MKAYLIRVPNRSYLQKEIESYMKSKGFLSYDEPEIFQIEAYSITYKVIFYKNTEGETGDA